MVCLAAMTCRISSGNPAWAAMNLARRSAPRLHRRGLQNRERHATLEPTVRPRATCCSRWPADRAH
eukprot:6716498-Pyramimonas_sp.AAC.1